MKPQENWFHLDDAIYILSFERRYWMQSLHTTCGTTPSALFLSCQWTPSTFSTVLYTAYTWFEHRLGYCPPQAALLCSLPSFDRCPVASIIVADRGPIGVRKQTSDTCNPGFAQPGRSASNLALFWRRGNEQDLLWSTLMLQIWLRYGVKHGIIQPPCYHLSHKVQNLHHKTVWAFNIFGLKLIKLHQTDSSNPTWRTYSTKEVHDL